MQYDLNGTRPKVDPDCYVAPGAHVIGDVELQSGVSVWFNAVIRGDVETITIGKNSNIQDGSVLHADQGFPLNVGEGVTVGHQVMIHGCEIGNHSLIGIQTVILNGAKIGEESIVGAKALITEGKQFPPRSLIIGSPAKAVRTLTDQEVQFLKGSALHYQSNGQHFKKTLSPI